MIDKRGENVENVENFRFVHEVLDMQRGYAA